PDRRARMNKPQAQARLSRLLDILETRREWRDVVRFNVRTGQIEKFRPPFYHGAAVSDRTQRLGARRHCARDSVAGK
ncbi:MAG: hypothetical protein U5P41_14410, partial [Gammaproteobacteria bacterium]|nr:hypothetical protein [Gammaproteobacteria bacterium]